MEHEKTDLIEFRCKIFSSFLTMRLLDSTTLQLKDFRPKEIPEYAILSHTWGKDEDEVLYADIVTNNAKGKAGYQKIRYCCQEAVDHLIHYVWIDTCCIDKSSSAELSEAINSMFSWYQKAKICYAYLEDVPANLDTGTLAPAFAESRWFKRGWTLQELIGPSDLVFFSRDWIEVGSKSTLYDTLVDITGINIGVLSGGLNLGSTSIAKRMSWASRRETTRSEDMAYCLMGLFDVNMPMLYGEGGEKAFIRLQEEIMKHSDDQSLLAWTEPGASEESHRSLLAKSPLDFVGSGNIFPYHDWESSAPFSMSNKGLRLELHITPCGEFHGEDLYVAALECPAPPDYEGFLGIYLKRVFTGDNQYARVKPQVLCKLAVRGGIKTVYVRQPLQISGPQDIYPLHAFQLRKGPTSGAGYKLIKVVPSSGKLVSAQNWSSHTQQWVPTNVPSTFKISKENNRLSGALELERKDGERLVILLGSASDFGVGFDAVSMSDFENIKDLQGSFTPHAPGTNLVLKNHQVRIAADPWIHSGAKYYMVDFFIDAIYHPDPINLFKEIMPGLHGHLDGPPPDAVKGSPSRPFEKLKSLFRTARIQDSSRVSADI